VDLKTNQKSCKCEDNEAANTSGFAAYREDSILLRAYKFPAFPDSSSNNMDFDDLARYWHLTRTDSLLRVIDLRSPKNGHCNQPAAPVTVLLPTYGDPLQHL